MSCGWLDACTLPGVVVAQDAVRVARDRGRSAHPFADVEEGLRAAPLDGGQAAVADQRGRHGRDVAAHHRRHFDDREPRRSLRARRSRRPAGPGVPTDGRESGQRGDRRHRDQDPLGVLGADPADEHQAGQRPRRRSRRRCWRRRRDRRSCRRPVPSTPPPRARAGSWRPTGRRRAGSPTGSARDRSGTGSTASSDSRGLIGQNGSDVVMFQLVHAIAAISRSCAIAQRAPRVLRPPRDEGAGAAAQADADQEHRQDDRERVGGPAEQQREQARPHHLGAERAHPRQADRQVDQPGVGRRARRGRTRRGRRRRAPASCAARCAPADTRRRRRPGSAPPRRTWRSACRARAAGRSPRAGSRIRRRSCCRRRSTRARRHRAAWSRPSARRRAASPPSSRSAGSGRSPRTGRAASGRPRRGARSPCRCPCTSGITASISRPEAAIRTSSSA